MRASSSPIPTGRSSSACREKDPRFVQYVGRARTTTCAPSRRGTASPCSMVARTDTGRDMSTSVSRRTRKAVDPSARRLSWTTWPSTHTGAIFAT